MIQGVRHALPQPGGQGVEQHVLRVVVAVRTQRRADDLVSRLMPHRAEQRIAVRAQRTRTPGAAPVLGIIWGAHPVHRPEAGSRQRDKHLRVARHGLRHALAAGHPRARHLIRITPIHARARPAARGAPIAAPDRHRPERSIRTGELTHDRPGQESDRQCPATQPDRTLARPDIPQHTLRPLDITGTAGKRGDPAKLFRNLGLVIPRPTSRSGRRYRRRGRRRGLSKDRTLRNNGRRHGEPPRNQKEAS